MTVDPATAAAAHDYNGHRYYFCSLKCAGKFKANPHQYLPGKKVQSSEVFASPFALPPFSLLLPFTGRASTRHLVRPAKRTKRRS